MYNITLVFYPLNKKLSTLLNLLRILCWNLKCNSVSFYSERLIFWMVIVFCVTNCKGFIRIFVTFMDNEICVRVGWWVVKVRVRMWHEYSLLPNKDGFLGFFKCRRNKRLCLSFLLIYRWMSPYLFTTILVSYLVSVKSPFFVYCMCCTYWECLYYNYFFLWLLKYAVPRLKYIKFCPFWLDIIFCGFW